MTTNKILTAMMIPALLLMFSGNRLSAQEEAKPKGCNGQEHKHEGGSCKKEKQAEPEGPFRNFVNIPGVNDKQKEDIRKIRLDLLKELRETKDLIMEKEARLRTLTRSDQPDAKAIDKVIDEIAELGAKARKRTEKARQQIRALLNEEQKLWFDSHCQGPGMGHGSQGHSGSCDNSSQKKHRNK